MLAKVAASLFEELGRPLPSLLPSLESGQGSSTGTTGLSGESATALSTEGDVAPGDRVLTRDEAMQIVATRKGKKPDA